MTKTDEGYHLDLSRSNYTVFSINIIGVYRRNVLAPLELTSLDVSRTKLDSLSELRGIRLQELRMVGLALENPKSLPREAEQLKLKRIVLDTKAYPAETIAELRKVVDVVDAKKSGAAKKRSGKEKKKATATPARPAGGESPGSTAP